MKPFWKWLLVLAVGAVYFIAAPVIYSSLKFESRNPVDAIVTVIVTGLMLLLCSSLIVILAVGAWALLGWLLEDK